MPSVLRLSPWRRGPRLLWRFPVVWWALAGTGTLLGLALALAPLYLGSIASASFAEQSAGRCTWTAGLQAKDYVHPGPPAGAHQPAKDAVTPLLGPPGQAVVDAAGDQGHLGPTVATLIGSAVAQAPPQHDAEALTLIYRDGAEQHVHVTARVPGKGILLTEEIAASLRTPPGSLVRLEGQPGHVTAVRVVGTYRDLADLPVQPYWCSLDPYVHLQDIFGSFPPQPIALTTEPDLAVAFQRAQPDSRVEVRLERPLDAGLTIDEGEQALAVVQQALREGAAPNADPRNGRASLTTQVPYLVRRAHAVQDATTPPIAALAAGAVLAALGLSAVSGGFWVERRRTEVELLSARGVGPGALAGKAALECGLPLLAGIAVGTALAAVTVVAFGPAATVSPRAVDLVAILAPVGAALAVGVLAAAVRLRLRAARQGAPLRSQRLLRSVGPLAWTVGEIALLVATLVSLDRVSPLKVSTDATSLPTFGLARLFLPLLALLLIARLAVRLLVAGLRRLRGRGDSWPMAALLASQRLAAVPRVPAALAILVAVACGTCLYSTGLANSLQRTVSAKATVFVGARTSIELQGPQPLPALPDGDRRTEVRSLADTTLPGGGAVDVLAVDPRTFPNGGAWDAAFADVPLSTLMARLSAPAVAGRVPAIAVGDLPDDPVVSFGREGPGVSVPFAVVGHARAFPGLHTAPLLVVPLPTMQATSPAAVRFSTERVWVDGPPQPLLAQLLSGGVLIRSTTTAEQVSAAPALEAVLQTLAALRALGLLAAVLAAIGLLVYVDVRARRRRLAAVLTRRMGLRGRTEWAAGWLELGAVAGCGVVIGAAAGLALVRIVAAILDPLPFSPPRPLVVLPTSFAEGLALAAALTTAGIAAAGLRRPHVDAAVLRAE